MKLLLLQSLSSTGAALIEAAGTDLWEIIDSKCVVRKFSRPCLLIQPFSELPEDKNHCVRTSTWVFERFDRDLKWEEVEV